MRFAGYYIISDLTGVPDLFEKIKPTLKSLIPGREPDESVKALKPWVRVVVSVWVLSVVPILLLGLTMLVIYGPWAVATAWDSFLLNYAVLSDALQDGGMLDSLPALINVGTLVAPVVGEILIFALVIKRWSAAVWRWSKDKPVLRAGFVLNLAGATSLLALVWANTNLAEVNPAELLPSLHDWVSWALR